MIAPTCFGPPGPSSGSLCRTLLKLQFCGDSKNTSLYVQKCCVKKCFRLWCVLCLTNCTAHKTDHSLKHFLPQYCWTYNDIFLLSPQNCKFNKVRHRLPDDGPGGPKHVGAIIW